MTIGKLNVDEFEPGHGEELGRAAASDAHVVLGPTHVVRRGREIVGYASIGGVLMINAWVHSQKVRARESFALLRLAERLAAERGAREILLPCAERSPFLPYIGKLGYARLGYASYNLKELR